MNAVRPVRGLPNLPKNQQFTQRLADEFNADERVWTSLGSLRRENGMTSRRSAVGATWTDACPNPTIVQRGVAQITGCHNSILPFVEEIEKELSE